MRDDSISKQVKRAIDVVGAILLLIVTAPVLVAGLIAVRMTMGRPILFRQKRAGHCGQIFTLYKVRTMMPEGAQTRSPLPVSLRLTPVGRLLRQLSIDELPQLWNVLRGEMSLIGPRPLLAAYLPRYSEFQARRHEMRPGITGYAQVAGRNALTWEAKFNLDVWYVTHWTLMLDIRIALATVWAVLSAKNTDEAGLPSEAEFSGN